MNTLIDTFKNLWFRDPNEEKIYINDAAVKIRAGILLAIPIFMSFTLYDAVFVSHWKVDGNTAVDTYDTDWDNHIIYTVEATKRTYDYTLQSWILVYGFLEMVLSMFVMTSRFLPTVLLSTFLARNLRPVWKPLAPKRFAWTIGATLISVCWVFFNPEVFAEWSNNLIGTNLPTTENYMSNWIPVTLVWICLGFMWLEAILGFCVGCKIHSLLVKVGIFKEECEDCNNIDWDAIAQRKAEKDAREAKQDA